MGLPGAGTDSPLYFKFLDTFITSIFLSIPTCVCSRAEGITAKGAAFSNINYLGDMEGALMDAQTEAERPNTAVGPPVA